MYKIVAKLYNPLLSIYFKEYTNIIDEKKKRLIKYLILVIYFLKVYDKWYEIYKEESKSQLKETIAERVKLRRQKADGEDLSDMPPLEGDKEEVKEGKGLKLLTPNKLLTRLPIY